MLAEFEEQVRRAEPNKFRDRFIIGGADLEAAAQLTTRQGHRYNGHTTSINVMITHDHVGSNRLSRQFFQID